MERWPFSVVMAPMNFANMPMLLLNELKSRGVTAAHIQYGEGQKLKYKLDRVIPYNEYGSRCITMGRTLKNVLDEDFDLFHYWNRSLYFSLNYLHNSGLDLPILKSRGKKILYRFSGFDVRRPALDKKVNPYSPFKYGYDHPFDERVQNRYLDFVFDYADELIVQDPELAQFVPNASVIPRALNLDDWKFVGIDKQKEVPHIVHAPTSKAYKGSKYIHKALDELQAEGLKFTYELIENVPHAEAVKRYQKADIIIDQILIGATGVLTLEALALGKPCVVYLHEHLFKPFYGGKFPFANANPDTIKDVIRKLVKDKEWRQQLSSEGRKLVEEYHSIECVTDKLLDLYSKTHEADVKKPDAYADIDWVCFQTSAANQQSKMKGVDNSIVSETYSFRLGNLIINAFIKPGKNTLMLPFKIGSLIYEYFASRKEQSCK